jgi:hypothetical protein
MADIPSRHVEHNGSRSFYAFPRYQQFRPAAVDGQLNNIFQYFKQIRVGLEAADDFAPLHEKSWSTYSYGYLPVCQEGNSSILARNSASKNPATIRKRTLEMRVFFRHPATLPHWMDK